MTLLATVEVACSRDIGEFDLEGIGELRRCLLLVVLGRVEFIEQHSAIDAVGRIVVGGERSDV